MSVSAVTSLEVAQLVFSGRLELPTGVESWMEETRELFSAPEIPLTTDLAAEAYRLPGKLHRDPADRLLVATARKRGFSLITADSRLIS